MCRAFYFYHHPEQREDPEVDEPIKSCSVLWDTSAEASV